MKTNALFTAFGAAAITAGSCLAAAPVEDESTLAEGGILKEAYTGKYVVIVNDQKRVPESDFFRKDSSINDLFGYPTKIVPPGTSLKDAGLVITISDNDKAPSLLVAPESPWAGINVYALAADKPKPEILVSRLQQEIWRAFMYACGAANSMMQPCVMRQVLSVKELDLHKGVMPCPDSLGRVMTTAKRLGIQEQGYVTYKDACEAGWAPPPTNDVQKAIWEKVHALPTAPLKINPGDKPKSGK